MRLILKVFALALAVLTAAGCIDEPPRPRSMAALGDSITRAFAACGRSGDCVETSWATGTAKDLNSHAQRLAIANPDRSHNLAVSGARVAGLAPQVEAAVRARPDYVTILIGANDVCTPTEVAMTSVEDYTGTFNAALNALVQGLPDAHVLVLSVPDLARLWEVGSDRPDVQRVWDSYGICQSMLASPTDTTPDAQARRSRVRARIQAYNTAMAAACAGHTPHCRSDGSAIFNYRFDLDDVSPVDYWHPSERGQATLAQVAWKAGLWS